MKREEYNSDLATLAVVKSTRGWRGVVLWALIGVAVVKSTRGWRGVVLWALIGVFMIAAITAVVFPAASAVSVWSVRVGFGSLGLGLMLSKLFERFPPASGARGGR
jgi:hypothetical protein